MRWAAGSISEMSTYYCPALAYQSDWDNKKVYVLRIGKFEVRVRMSMLNIRRRKPPMKSGQRYFPPLVNWSVVENNACAFLASLRRQEVYSCGACADECPIANARHRFAAGSARRTAKRKKGKRHPRPLPGPPIPRERGFIFYHSS